MKKVKIISAVAAAVVAVSSMFPCMALQYGEEWEGYTQTQESVYNDVPETHWAFNAISRVKAAGWFSGYPDGSFKPSGSITREEAMTVMVKFLGLELKTTETSTYYDVDTTRWSSAYIEAGKKLLPARTAFNGNVPFQPEMPITREDVMYAMVIAKKYNNEVTFADQSILNMFSDKNSISENIKGYVATAVKVGLVSGHANGTIGAQDPLTRAEFASMLYRAQSIGDGTGGGLADVPEVPVVPETPAEATVTSISVTPLEKTIAVGESFTITATATMSDGTTSDYTQKLVMTSDNDNVSVSGNTVTGVKAGISKISFTGSDLLANVNTTVTVNANDTNTVVAENGVLNGKVAYASDPSRGIEGATVCISGGTSSSVVTDAEGNYTVTVPAGDYRLTASFTGYNDGQINASVTANITNYAETILLTNDSEGSVKGTVYDAFVQDGVIEGAKIIFRAGGDNKTGDVAGETVTAADGSYSIDLPAGNYTAEASKDGYITVYKNVVSQMADSRQDISLTPVLNENEWRFVLTWGEHPRDLDSHLTGPKDDGSRFHVVYYDRTARENDVKLADLDVDDTTSYGPETVTIYEYKTGVYRYSVHDYTNRYAVDSDAMSKSGAVVKVYNGERLVKTFNMPTNVKGTLWTVFELNNGVITPINEITEVSQPGGVQSVTESKYDENLIRNMQDK